MKNSILYIVGAVALLGGGAFLFLKNKKNKDKEKLALAEMQTATTGAGTPTTTPTTTPEEDLKKLEVAKGIAIELKGLRNAKAPLKKTFDAFSGKGGMKEAVAKTAGKKIAEIDKKTEALNITLKAMGYTESDGNIVKIA
jgi:LPXTG-motif cell wall-anchored protein